MFVKPTTLCLIVILAFLQNGTSKRANRLAKESSPYLLQHARNPVDWYPWGEEALRRAKDESKMIFLSVGYAACHWCHVMERESFEDEEIAKFLNENYICIKVDREERPDIDQIYMTAVQIMSGRAGWPMSVLMTSDAKPIFGGSYFPARDGDRGSLTGFLTIVRRASQLWKEDNKEMLEQADRIADALQVAMTASESIPSGSSIDRDQCRQVLNKVQQRLASGFDASFGGFHFLETTPDRPKFPEPSNLVFLLDRAKRDSVDKEDREAAKSMLLKTLDSLIAGGIYDHLGGGFHRYSTDRFWRIPHFEKMLYDNAQLASLYASAFEWTGIQEYRTIAEATCDFVIRELKAPSGAFYTSLDADSEGEEGKYYRWEKEEADRITNTHREASLFAQTYGFNDAPNFEGKYYAPQPGKTLTQVALERKSTLEELSQALSISRHLLFEARSKRIRPLTDLKVLTSWNGLTIAGLADAGRILQREDYILAAKRAAEFVLMELKTKDGRLLRSHALGESKLQGYLDDYAFLVHGLLRLHKATQEQPWLSEAIALTRTQIQFFHNEESGGFYYTAVDQPELIVRFQDPIDGVIPSGNSLTASNLLYIANAAERAEFEGILHRVFQSTLSLIEKNPSAATLMSTQIAEWLDRP
jgi:uncharacterized protein YyaL (SSP411 family)